MRQDASLFSFRLIQLLKSCSYSLKHIVYFTDGMDGSVHEGVCKLATLLQHHQQSL